MVVPSIVVDSKVIYTTGATIYKTLEIRPLIAGVIERYPTL